MALDLLLQFQPGATLNASVTDLTTTTTEGVTWKWYRGTSDRGPWGEPISGADDGTCYTLVDTPDTDQDIDVDKYLRAEASYGGKTANFVSPNLVQRARLAANTPPAFPSTTVMRSVAENTAVGANIGAAVEAEDVDGDILTYTLVGNNNDNAKFDIDNATGRLKVKEALDFEAEPAEFCGDTNVYTVVVRATDSSGDDTGDGDYGGAWTRQ